MSIFKILKNIFVNINTDSDLMLGLDQLNSLIRNDTKLINLETLNLIDVELLDEIKRIQSSGDTDISFGQTLRDIKCVIEDDENVRKHEIFIQYMAPKKLCITMVNLPYSNIQNKEYTSIQEIIIAFKKYVNDLSCYLNELELIDQQCAVMEPVNPTFKDDYRRILIDDRTWLHIEVTPEGLSANIHLMNQSELWQDKLKDGLLLWNHDKNIINNIMSIFGLQEFPQKTRQLTSQGSHENQSEFLVCSICLCTALPGISNVPQPLCQNTLCGVYFHRSCLYEWLIASESRPDCFGVATGSCPSCLQPIACSELDT